MNFDFNGVEFVEFGVGLDQQGDDQSFFAVAVDGGVQDALGEMAEATWNSMVNVRAQAEPYEPSEKYGSLEHLVLPIQDNLAQRLRMLHEAANLQMNNAALNEPDAMFCYFCRLRDNQNRRLTAVRRAAQFKGVLRKRLLRLCDDTMNLLPDRVFKLDQDFDLLIDNQSVHVLRPSGLEFVGKLQSAILAAVPQNVTQIQAEMAFVDFANILDYATQHTRAARYLASIRSQDLQDIIPNDLILECQALNVQIENDNGTISVDDNHVMGFLEVLDRRRLVSNLRRNNPEIFRTLSRKKISN